MCLQNQALRLKYTQGHVCLYAQWWAHYQHLPCKGAHRIRIKLCQQNPPHPMRKLNSWWAGLREGSSSGGLACHVKLNLPSAYSSTSFFSSSSPCGILLSCCLPATPLHPLHEAPHRSRSSGRSTLPVLASSSPTVPSRRICSPPQAPAPLSSTQLPGGSQALHPARALGRLLDPLPLRTQVSGRSQRFYAPKAPTKVAEAATPATLQAVHNLKKLHGALRPAIPCPLQQLTGILNSSVTFSGWKLTDWLFRIEFTVATTELVIHGHGCCFIILYQIENCHVAQAVPNVGGCCWTFPHFPLTTEKVRGGAMALAEGEMGCSGP